ncbi:20S proteasome subunit beta 2 [Nematocida homosporus]|uniref:20S proteasome subunit beta 2 n=1 Tax=Nematocida homosporus TaxID=1912981 RepID=UPI002220705A|nr:20S proteasome subunit beta 2 [Nematocida homosporus]KAI5185373.1 20S proteasome subunit beta 2 [Nematocida homosporus]
MVLRESLQAEAARYAEKYAEKTGTTIVGVKGKDYVVLAADTRSTNGPIVANKNCSKIHRIADNIFCCGAGTAADTRFTTKMAECSMYRYALKYDKVPLLSYCINILKRHLFRYQGYVQAALIIGGVDETGPVLCGIHPHGSIDNLPYTALGSGSYAAIGMLESQWKEDMSVDEAIALACSGIEAGIQNDLYSGSNIDLCVIKTDQEKVFITEYHRPYKVVGKKEEKNAQYRYPRASVLVKKEEIINLVDIRDALNPTQ